MHSLPLLLPPNLESYGQDYPKYLEHYKLFREFVISCKREFKLSLKASPVQTVGDGKPQGERTKIDGYKPKGDKPSRVRSEAARLAKRAKNERRRTRLELRELENQRKKAIAISAITAANAKIVPSEGWTLVAKKHKKKSLKTSPKVKASMSSEETKSPKIETSMSLEEMKKRSDVILAECPVSPNIPTPSDLRSMAWLLSGTGDIKEGKFTAESTPEQRATYNSFVTSRVFKSAFPEMRDK